MRMHTGVFKRECTLEFLNKTPVCERRVNLLVYSLSLHRHSSIGFILAFVSSIHNKQLYNSYQFVTPTLIYTSYLCLSLYWFIINKNINSFGESGSLPPLSPKELIVYEDSNCYCVRPYNTGTSGLKLLVLHTEGGTTSFFRGVCVYYTHQTKSVYSSSFLKNFTLSSLKNRVHMSFKYTHLPSIFTLTRRRNKRRDFGCSCDDDGEWPAN